MMWIVQLALRRRYTFIVMALLIAVLGGLTIVRTPTDIFPTIDVPVVSVIWGFGGLEPHEMESRMVTISERSMTTTVNDIEHIESQSYPGVGVIKIFFHPNVNVAAAVAQVTSINQTLLRAMPPGTTPPLILQFSASSVPILQLGASSDKMTLTQVYDYSTNFVRTQLATVQGASVPNPYGAAPRQIIVDLDIAALHAKGLAPSDVLNAISAENVIAPAGTVKIGSTEYNVKTNSQPDVVADFNELPIKYLNGALIRIGDVAHVHDGHAIQTNIVNQDGRPAVLMSILKNGGASTIDVVRRVKAALPGILKTLPPDYHVKTMFDQSVFVAASVEGVLREAVIAACLTAIMILLFLGSWRSTFVVVISIPLSILVSVILLGALGQTINIMTLGGLALAVGILVDDATVEIENANRNLAMGHKTLTRAILDGAAQIATPTFVATLSICIVFVPVVFLSGTARSLFTPLAEAVVFAMMASYLLSRTLVPVMVQMLMRPDVDRIVAEEKEENADAAGMLAFMIGHKPTSAIASDVSGEAGGGRNGAAGHGDGFFEAEPAVESEDLYEASAAHGDIIWRTHHRFNRGFERFRLGYTGLLAWSMRHRLRVALAFGGFFLISLALLPMIGEDFFPNVDAGQILLHVQGPSGQRLEETNRLFHRVEDSIKKTLPPGEIDTILDNIGLAPGLNLAYSNSPSLGALDGDIMLSLKSHGSTERYVKMIRNRLRRDFPQTVFFFEPSDITTQILNFGLPAPIDIQVVGRSPENAGIARRIATDVRSVPGAVDVHVHQVTDVPELSVNVDRERAKEVGLSDSDVVNNMLTSLVGTGQVTPSYYLDPKNGVSYLVQVMTPQRSIADIGDLKNTPLLPAAGINEGYTGIGGGQQEQLLQNIASIHRTASPQIIDHYNVQPTYDVYVSAGDRDLGGVARDVQKVIDGYQKHLPRGTTMVLRGQVDSMNSSFLGLGLGLIFAVLLAYLLMVVNFQSWIDPFVIIMALPGAVSGILWMLFITQTTFSVPSLMGSLMCIGVAVSNSILLITFANDRREEGASAIEAAVAAGYTRLRPVLMTALALILGMLPMALGLGEGGEQNAPLGRAVIGGATVATFTTLFFVPIVYSILRRKDTIAVEEEIEIDRYAADEEDDKERRLREAQAAGERAERVLQGEV